MKIKIYGERNSGTNYLEKLIETNLAADILKFQTYWWSLVLLKSIKYDFVQDVLWRLQRKKTLGWKHGQAPINAIKSYSSNPLVVVTITKNPYSFLHSLYKKPYHVKGGESTDFYEFICQPWITRGRDLCTKKKLESPIELWNLKNQSYLNLRNKVSKVVINITYEQLLKQPEECIRKIASKGNIPFRNEGQFQNYIASTKDSKLSYESYKKYYLQEEWISAFNEVNLTNLNSKIDDDLMEFFNYKKIFQQN